MRVKGSAIETLPVFIKQNFGDDGYEKWFSVLTPEAQEVYANRINTSAWYPLKQILPEPTKKICELFYKGNIKGAWEGGRFSADSYNVSFYFNRLITIKKWIHTDLRSCSSLSL